MVRKNFLRIKNILLPCIFLSAITGALTGALIFLFKIAATAVIELSQKIYVYAQQKPIIIPLVIAAAAIIGVLSAFILRVSPSCRGGGIPTAIAILRGLISFNWLKSIFLLFASALLSYLGGVPLGNEGPSVQMGAAVGKGAVNLLAKKDAAWSRYIMTGGACAGFAAATGAPVSGIFFALEEAHRRFSPMILMSAATSVISGSITMELLCRLNGSSSALFELSNVASLPLSYIWAAVAVGLICGVLATLFTKFYRFIHDFLRLKLDNISFTLKVVTVFVAVVLIGLISADALGTGHSLIEKILRGEGVWYLIITVILVRAILLIVANNVGITGGLFVPSLAFGAAIGGLCGKALIAMNVLPTEYHIVMVIIGMASFISASSRTPITAVIFAIEALGGINNVLPLATGALFAYVMIETTAVTSFTDTVIDTKVALRNKNKTAVVIDTHYTVQPSSFIVGKEVRDILWPPTCTVLSVQKSESDEVRHGGEISDGDVIHVHYMTYDNAETVRLFEAIVGKQTHRGQTLAHNADDDYVIPEIT